MSNLLAATYLAAAAALAPLPTTAPQDAVQTLREADRAAFDAWSHDRLAEALDGLSTAVAASARELATVGDADLASRLADDTEFALVDLRAFARDASDLPSLERRLAGVSIDPEHGDAFARLAWIAKDGGERLGAIVDWQFVGPFDNERGGGIDAPLPPYSAPDAPSYSGKVREVAWRRTPLVRPTRSVVDLGELVDPSSSVCVLARTWVRSEVEREALVFLGFTEEARAWVGGASVLVEKGERDFEPDAHAVAIHLDEGWNEIAVLVGSRGGAPAFTARLAERGTSRPLALACSPEPPDGVVPCELDAATDAPLRDVATGARARWADDDGALGALRRSVLERAFDASPRSERAGREDAARAVELAPDDVRALIQRAVTLDERGSSAEKDVNPWLHALDDVLAVDPENVWALRQKALHAMWNQPTFERSLELLDRALAIEPASVPALVLKAAVLDRLDQPARARVVREQVVDMPESRTWPAARWSCTGVLRAGDPRRAEIARAAFEANGDSSAMEAWAWAEIASLGTSGDLDALDRFARERVARDAWSVNARLTAATEFVSVGEPDRALDWLDEALELAPERPSLHKWRARALLAKGDVENAVSALERELEYDFSAEDERRLLEHLRSVGADPFHQPYLEPLDDVLARSSGPPEVGSPRSSREVLLNRVVVEIQPDGTAKRYHRLVQRVLTERGARDLDRIPFRAFGNQEVRVLTADVRGVDGRTKRAETGRSTWGMLVDLPPLAVGDVVDLEWRTDDLRPTFFGEYFGMNEPFAPDATVPTQDGDIVVIAPKELPIVHHERAGAPAPVVSPRDDGSTEYRWRMRDVAPIDPEPLMPPAEETAAAVQVSTYPSWQAFGTWWWNLIEQEMQASPEMRSKVAELTQDCTTPLEKLRAVYEFVVTDIRYNAWEFGVHGYQPYSAPVIFSRGFGDCKDKAILMRTLLGVAGIEAWPVLIRAEDRRPEEDHALALVEHFNHCIVWVPEQDGIPGMFLDGTARLHPFGEVPSMDAGADVLVVEKSGIEQREVPFPTAEHNELVLEHTVVLGADGPTSASLTVRPSGRYGAADRTRYTGGEEQRSEEATRVFARTFGPTSAPVASTFSDLEDLREPVVYTLSGRPDSFGRETDTGRELPATLRRHGLLSSVARESERRTDLLLDVPFSVDTTTRYVLGDGLVAAQAPPDASVECPDGAYSFTVRAEPDGWTVTEHFEIRTHRVPAERYAQFREFARRVDAAQEAVFEVEVAR
ncbi:MAG: DUF3857 domain-containing protein [Planctomycetota bacterium]